MYIAEKGLLALGAALIGLGVSAYQTYKMSKNADKLDMALEDVSKRAKVDIEEQIVNKAIERAVDREVRRAVEDTARRVREDIKMDIDREVRRAVDDQYKRISDDVSDTVAEKISAIDEASLKEKVMRKAEDKIVQKLNTGVNGLLSDAGKHIAEQLNVTRTFQNALNNALSGGSSGGDSGKTLNLRLG